jgi:hypothetical protein
MMCAAFKTSPFTGIKGYRFVYEKASKSSGVVISGFSDLNAEDAASYDSPEEWPEWLAELRVPIAWTFKRG